LKVLLLNANLRGVGTFVRALNFGWALTTAGHEVTLCTVSRTETRGIARDHQRGVAILEMPRLGYQWLPGWGSGPLDILGRWRLIRQNRFDVIFGFEYQPNVSWPVYLTWRRRTYRFLSDWCDWHAGGSNVYRGIKLAHRIDGWFEERIRYLAEQVTVISPLLKERALAMGLRPEHVTLIEEGVDTAYIRPLPQADMRARLGLPAGVPIVATITDADMGRPVRILQRLHAIVPTAHLLVIGRRDPVVAQAARELKLDTRVHETGFVADDDLPRYLACADVCFLPLVDALVNRARWPAKANDFLAAGKATVVSPVGVFGELMKSAALGGLAWTDAEFAEALAALWLDPDRRADCGRQARELAVSRLDWNVLRDKIVRVVEHAVQ